MINRQVQLVILCEDQQHEVFARHFFISRGFHPRKIRSKINPKGKGAGEQYVRRNYPAEVKAYRGKKNHLSVSLIVIIDADNFSVIQRLNQLDETITPKRQPDEIIAIFVPKRNIETWIHYLKGNPVDEESIYPRLARAGDCKPYIQQLIDQCHQGLDQSSPPPSLLIARDELHKRLGLRIK